MYNIGHISDWQTVAPPPDAKPPAPMTMRAQSLPPRSYFPEHAHEWGQLVYAISGVLTVAIVGRSFVISPEQAVWLPTGVVHRVGSLLGAEFRSLWIAADARAELPGEPVVHAVGPLLKALIAELAALPDGEDDSYVGRITHLILDQLHRATRIPVALPWPRDGALVRLCAALYADPADSRPATEWARELGMSSRTLTRRFETEVGMSLRSWRRRMRLSKAIELLGGGTDVTGVALELGYSSPSAFIYAFRTAMDVTPQAFAGGKVGRS